MDLSSILEKLVGIFPNDAPKQPLEGVKKMAEDMGVDPAKHQEFDLKKYFGGIGSMVEQRKSEILKVCDELVEEFEGWKDDLITPDLTKEQKMRTLKVLYKIANYTTFKILDGNGMLAFETLINIRNCLQEGLNRDECEEILKD